MHQVAASEASEADAKTYPDQAEEDSTRVNHSYINENWGFTLHSNETML